MKIVKNLIAIIVVVGLLIWGGLTLSNNKKRSEEETRIVAQSNDSISVNVSTVAYRNIETDFLVNGIFEPEQELNFPSETAGKVVRVLVEEGSRVHVGQTLAVIRSDQQSIDLSAAEAAYQNALTDNQRFENALKTGGVTQQQVDMSRLQLKNAKAQLDQARIRVGDTNVKATINGIVNQRFIEPGSFVSPGTPMFEIVNVSNLKLRVDVDESQIVNYKVGDPIKVKASVYPEKEFDGKITFIAPKASASLNFPVDVQVDNSSNDLRAGMYGTAIFSTNEETASTPILTVERKAFVGGLNNQEIFVVEDGKVKLKKVRIGRNFGEFIEILDGLNENEVVVTTGHINLNDGATVKIMNE